MSGSGAKQSQEETILTLLAANHSLQQEIAALREKLAEAVYDCTVCVHAYVSDARVPGEIVAKYPSRRARMALEKQP